MESLFPVDVNDTAPSAKQYTRLSIRPGPNASWLVALNDGRHEPHVFMDKHLALTYAKAWAAANRPSKLQVMGQTAHVEQEWTFA